MDSVLVAVLEHLKTGLEQHLHNLNKLRLVISCLEVHPFHIPACALQTLVLNWERARLATENLRARSLFEDQHHLLEDVLEHALFVFLEERVQVGHLLE